MQEYLQPGIRVEEGISRTQAIPGTEDRPTAFIGACMRGPCDQPVLVTSAAEFEKKFGAVSADIPLSIAVRMFFLNGGRKAWIVRVARQARPGGIELQTDDTPLVLWSQCVGAHEHLRVAVDYDGIDAVDRDCFNLTVQRLDKAHTENVIDQEIYRYTSISEEHPNFIAPVVAGSRMVRCAPAYPATRPRETLNHGSGKADFFRGISLPGADGTRITMADVLGSSAQRTGLFAFTRQYDFDQLYIPPVAARMDLSVPLLRTAARICERRRAVLIVDAPQSWDSVATALQMLDRFSLRGSNVALYYPWIVTTDPLTGTAMTIPPGGAVAGVLARCAHEAGPSGAPAGRHALIRGVRRFADNVNEPASYQLARKGVNSLRSARGGRRVIWDAVLLTPNDGKKDQVSSLKVRRVLQYIAKSIEDGLQWTVFEQNNEKLWKKVQEQVHEFLLRSMKHGLLQGVVPDAAFRVRCDLETNPGSLRAQNKVGLVVDVAPTLPSRFVKLSLQMPAAGGDRNG